jgi:outer membrane protein
MHKLITLGFSIVITAVGWTQENNFDLESAKIYALENNLSVHNAQMDIEIAKKQITETRGMGLPQIDLTGSFNHFINLPVTVMEAKFLNPMAPDGETIAFQAGTEYTSNGTLQVNQILFNGSYIVALQVASFFREFQEGVSNKSKEDVVFNVIQAYEMASVAKQNIAFMAALVVSTQQLIEKQQHFLDLGIMEQEDMDQLSFSLVTAQSAKTTADIQYQNALAMLKLSMGYPMGDPIEIKNTPDELMSKNAISTGDFHSNLNYTILESQVKLSEFSVKNDKFANLPSLNAFFQHSYNAYRNEFNFFADEKWHAQTLWGLQLNVPIFSGLSRHARTAQSKIQLMKDQNNLIQMEQTLQFQELQLRNNLRGAQDKLDLEKKNIELAQSIYDKAVIKDDIGKGNSIIVTQKQNQLVMAQAQYLGSMMEFFQTKLALDILYNNVLQNK